MKLFLEPGSAESTTVAFFFSMSLLRPPPPRRHAAGAASGAPERPGATRNGSVPFACSPTSQAPPPSSVLLPPFPPLVAGATLPRARFLSARVVRPHHRAGATLAHRTHAIVAADRRRSWQWRRSPRRSLARARTGGVGRRSSRRRGTRRCTSRGSLPTSSGASSPSASRRARRAA